MVALPFQLPPKSIRAIRDHVSHQRTAVSRSVSSVVKNLCDFASLLLCVKALSHSCVSCLTWSKIRESASIRVNPSNCDTCSYLQLIAPNCSYLHYLRYLRSHYFLMILQLCPFWPKTSQNHRQSTVGPPAPGPHHVSRFTFHVSPSAIRVHPRRGEAQRRLLWFK
jgi:hypothetical protein